MKHLLFLALFTTSLFSQDPERIRHIIYAKHDGVALTMDVFKPAKPNGAGVIKIVSGGRKSNHNGINDGGWAKAGYTTFVVVHGTQPRFQVGEIVADLNRARCVLSARMPRRMAWTHRSSASAAATRADTSA